MPLLNASSGANKISGKSSPSRANDDKAKILHTYRGRQCVISDPTDFFVSPPSKNGHPFDCSISITANRMIASIHCAVNNSPIALVVSNFHIYGEAWPHEISRYHPWDMPIVGPATPNMPSVENSLFEHCNMVCFEKWRKYVFSNNIIWQGAACIYFRSI